MITARPLVFRGEAASRATSLPVLAVLALIMVGMLSLLYLTQASGAATAGYDLVTIQSQRDALRLRNEQLRLRIAEAQALDRVESQARTRLQMAPPVKVVYVRVPSARRSATSTGPQASGGNRDATVMDTVGRLISSAVAAVVGPVAGQRG